ncbi:MAG: triose-phosphate isomerase, partial [Planctomycetes bacterium]|nr:triose-phosphate isomerase [Planctomycetota bacterium]
WKMNLDLETSVGLVQDLRDQVGDVDDVTLAVGPPFVYLNAVADILEGTKIGVAAQNMYTQPEGAYTGEVSGPMLLDVGCEYVILGHSERRHVFAEPDELINQKVQKAFEYGLKPIVCVGEKLEQRKAGDTERIVCGQVESALEGVVREQMEEVTLAYEPVWAIGTGETATPQQAEQVHAIIRSLVTDLFDAELADELVIQYGGSVKPHNAADLLAQEDVDGALVGGASLAAETFVPIIEAGQNI